MDLLILLIAVILAYLISSLRKRVARFEAALQVMEERLQHLGGGPVHDRAPAAPAAPSLTPPGVPVSSFPVAAATEVAPAFEQPEFQPAPAPMRAGGLPPSPRPRPLAFPRLSTEFEMVIGTSWLNRLGIIAIIAAVAYFLKYSFDNQWIGPEGRIALTWLLGVALVGTGERYQRRKLAVFAQGLTGGGIAVLYFAVYAAFAIYHVVAWAPSFLLMILITGAAVLLALRYDAMTIALLGLVAGFATPMLLRGDGATSTAAGQPVSAGLYGYLLLLDAATYLLARRKQWWILGGTGLAAAFLLPVIVAQAGTPNPGAGLVYFLLLTIALLMFSMLHQAIQLAWVALAGGFIVVLAGGIMPLVEAAPYVNLTYFGVVTIAAIALAHRLNWRSVANAAFLGGLVLGSGVILGTANRSLPIIAAYLVVMNAVMLYASLQRRWRGSPLFALVVNAFVATAALIFAGHAPAGTRVIGAAALFVLYNLTLATASREETESRLGSVLLSSAVFAVQLGVILEPSRDALALGALVVAAYHVIVGRALLRRVPPLTVLLFMGLALTFLTVAVPLKLHGEAVSLAWAVETAVLAWAAGRAGSVWAGRAAVVVAAVTVVRLIAVETPRIETSGLIGTLPGLAFASGIAALGLAYRLLKGLPWATSEERYFPQALGATSATLLLFWVGWEIDGFFSRGIASAGAEGAKQVALSAWFALYGVGLLVAGIWKNVGLVRWAGIALIGATILKVFLVDLVAVAPVFRVLSLGILGVLLLLASLAYNRSRARLTSPHEAPGETRP